MTYNTENTEAAHKQAEQDMRAAAEGKLKKKGCYKVTIGGEPIFTGLSLQEAKAKCRLALALSSRLDIFYSKEGLAVACKRAIGS